jgi:acyl-CoA thioesterase-1
MITVTNFIAVQFLDGTVYFVGLALACIAVVAGMGAKGRWPRFASHIAMVTGAILVLASATPVPLWAYIFWTALLAATVALSNRRRWADAAVTLLCVVSAIMAVVESPYHRPVKIPIAGFDTLFVVGDSLSQGAHAPSRNWPELLGEKAGLKTVNLGVPGAKVANAVEQARRIDKDAALVLLEIGGNDLLDDKGGFEKGLEALLAVTCKPGRLVVMVELPLPPTFNRFGAAQRRLAKRYGVRLIPKKFLAGVLGKPSATEDGLHLSNEGHVLLAESLFRLFDKSTAKGL